MDLQTLEFKTNVVNYLCTVCVTDNNGAKVALTIICVIGFMIAISLVIGSNISP